jgi:hypothetical protein
MTASPGIGGTGGAPPEVEYTGGRAVEDRYTEVFRLRRRWGTDVSCGIGGRRLMLGRLPVNT